MGYQDAPDEVIIAPVNLPALTPAGTATTIDNTNALHAYRVGDDAVTIRSVNGSSFFLSLRIMQAFDSLWHWTFGGGVAMLRISVRFVTRLAGPVVKTFLRMESPPHPSGFAAGFPIQTPSRQAALLNRQSSSPRMQKLPTATQHAKPRQPPLPSSLGSGAHMVNRRIPATAPRDRAYLKYRYTRRCIYPLSATQGVSSARTGPLQEQRG